MKTQFTMISALMLFCSMTFSQNPAQAQVAFPYFPIPGSGHTHQPLAATTYQGQLWLFMVEDNGGVEYQTFDESTFWSGTYRLLPNNKPTNNAVSVCVFRGKLYVFVVGQDDNEYYRTFDGVQWSDYVRITNGHNTTLPLCAVTTSSGIDVFLVNSAREIYQDETTDGVNWGLWRKVPGKSNPVQEVAAVYDSLNKYLYLIITERVAKHYYVRYQYYKNSAWLKSYAAIPGIVKTVISPTATVPAAGSPIFLDVAWGNHAPFNPYRTLLIPSSTGPVGGHLFLPVVAVQNIDTSIAECDCMFGSYMFNFVVNSQGEPEASVSI